MIKLICTDMDGVLVAQNNIWLALHQVFGTLEEGAQLTKAYLTTDYNMLVNEVVNRLWKGRDAKPYYDLVRTIAYNNGISEFFKELDDFRNEHGEQIPRAIISGGAYDLAERVKNEFGITFIFANQLIVHEGKISGEFKWPVGAGGYTKRQIIEQLCDDLEILPADVLFIGDSDSDLEAFNVVGTSIAFNSASEKLKSAATYVVNSNNLMHMIPILRQIREEKGVGSGTEGPGVD